MKFTEKMQSRKFSLIVFIIVLATLGAFVPPIVGIFGVIFKILSGAEWVTVISLTISAYIAGNSWQNRAEISNAVVAEEETSGVETTIEVSNREEDGEA